MNPNRKKHALETLESLLALPTCVEQRDGAWLRLTHDDAFYLTLRDVVENCDDPPWPNLLEYVEAWRGKYDPFDDADKNRLLRQWWFLRCMVWCAQQAARIKGLESKDSVDEIRRSCFSPDNPPEYCGNGVTPDWAAGCIEAFMNLSKPVRHIQVDAAGWERNALEGFIFTLHLELLDGGAGQIFHHPADAFRTYLDDSFEESMRLAWMAAKDLVEKQHPTNIKNFRARFRVMSERQTPNQDKPLREIIGSSAGGAATRGWSFALMSKVPDDEILVLAQITSPKQGVFELAEVSGIKPKSKTVRKHRRIDTVLVAGEENRREAEEVLEPSHVKEADLDSVPHIRSRRVEDLLSYLRGLEHTLEWIPAKDILRSGNDGRTRKAVLPFTTTERSKAKFTMMNKVVEIREKLEKFDAPLEELVFPAFLRLGHLVETLENEEKLIDFLVGAECLSERPSALSDADCAAAAMLRSLVEHHGITNGLAPWVWNRLTREAGETKESIHLWLDGEDY